MADLLTRAESQVIDGVPAYGPGAIYQHLCRADPGAALGYQPSEAYVRARRDRDRRRELERHAENAAKPKAVHPLEAEWGSVLDGLETAELFNLLESAEINAEHRKAVKQWMQTKSAKQWMKTRKKGDRVGFLRDLFLESLAAQTHERLNE